MSTDFRGIFKRRNSGLPHYLLFARIASLEDIRFMFADRLNSISVSITFPFLKSRGWRTQDPRIRSRSTKLCSRTDNTYIAAAWEMLPGDEVVIVLSKGKRPCRPCLMQRVLRCSPRSTALGRKTSGPAR